MPLSDNAKKFKEHNPTYIGTMAGHKYYEDPIYGDEAPLKVITPEGELKTSIWWEMPDDVDYVLKGDI